MTNNVVGLRGCEPFVKEPVASVVAQLEALLELARAGEVIGIQCVTVGPDALVGLYRAGVVSYGAVGMLFCAAHEGVQRINETDK